MAGRGWYRINDRGPLIKDGNLDLVVETREEAFIIGRETVLVLVIPPKERG